MGGGGIRPCVGQRLEASLLAGDRGQDVQQIMGRAGQVVEPGHSEPIVGFKLAKRLAELA